MSSDQSEPRRTSIERSSGITTAERYLGKLCEKTFLSLWSYPRLYRDQRVEVKAEGKEVADLLVIFEDDIIVFSDKHCAFPSSVDLRTDWRRWFRRAVVKAAEQAWGAERWIRAFPDRLFLDKQCTRRFPLPLPSMSRARFHLVVVAHGIASHCAQLLGGSGSLMIRSNIRGAEAHSEPFIVGDVDPDRSFVHILDDTTLAIVMRTLDTIADLTMYLRKKERLLRSEPAIAAAGEEELLAVYLTRIGADGEHDFDLPLNATGIAVGEGYWEEFESNPQRTAQVEANRVSYTWDRLIETFNRHALGGTQYRLEGYEQGIELTERIVRFMAREPRLRRRMLAEAIHGLLERTSKDRRASRVILPSRTGDPFYVFLLLPKPEDRPYEEYRQVRSALLNSYCQVVKIKFPEANDIVGIATEPGFKATRSEDAAYLDARGLSEEDLKEARVLQDELKILTNTSEWRTTVKEYPTVRDVRPMPLHVPVAPGRNPRNKPCPCGSGRKYKKCHGR